MQAPELTTVTRAGEPVRLRAHTDSDATFLVALMAEPEVTRWLPAVPQPYTVEHASTFIRERPTGWACPGSTEQTLMVDVDGVPAGQVGLRTEARTAELGYVVAPRFAGRGVISAAVRALAGWALSPAGADLLSLVWRAEVGNWASRRVAWACGFQVGPPVRGLLPCGTGVRDGWVATLCRDDPTAALLPWLETPRLDLVDVLLRPFVPADAAGLVEGLCDPQTVQYLPSIPTRYTEAEAGQFLAAVDEEAAAAIALAWAICPAADPQRLVGGVGLRATGQGRLLGTDAEIGYWVHRESRGHGYARSATRAVARHALLPVIEGGLGLLRVLLRAAPDNTASQRVAQACGFTRSGCDRQAQRLHNGRVVDLLRYELLAIDLADSMAHPSAMR